MKGAKSHDAQNAAKVAPVGGLDAIEKVLRCALLTTTNAGDVPSDDEATDAWLTWQDVRATGRGGFPMGVIEIKRSIIGYDVQLIKELSKRLHKAAAREHLTTDPSETMRGETFEVALPDSRFARVTIELDRVDPDLAEKIAAEQSHA